MKPLMYIQHEIQMHIHWPANLLDIAVLEFRPAQSFFYCIFGNKFKHHQVKDKNKSTDVKSGKKI